MSEKVTQADLEAENAKLREEILAVHRKLAAAELDARVGWERYEMANRSHMDASMRLSEANAKLAANYGK